MKTMDIDRQRGRSKMESAFCQVPILRYASSAVLHVED
ncbi:hypothetical protein ACPOL_2897 [Acidisarcina polymorpha]|uniref:Uncharacterized protein n=1 Tax=Acidisarcina polymorpha TaxID=2211140 RepID=A0A2Z5FZB0_9BACT|nr:hypothetical protein ACPOL_2897 [Acidisarcina polymorpha]